MPFDGREYDTRIAAVDKLDRMIDQLASEDRWCKGALYTVDGRRCMVGAMQSVDGGAMLKKPILQAIREVTGRRYAGIETFNDRRSTNYALVRLVLERTRLNLLEGKVELRPVAAAQGSWLKRLVSAC